MRTGRKSSVCCVALAPTRYSLQHVKNEHHRVGRDTPEVADASHVAVTILVVEAASRRS
jgi:hypothetical protein